MQTPDAPDSALTHLPAVINNKNAVGFMRNASALIMGCATGVTGIYGYHGFIYYFLGHAAVTGAILFKSGLKPSVCFSSPGQYMLEGAFSSTTIMTFLLFWTITYNLTHVF